MLPAASRCQFRALIKNFHSVLPIVALLFLCSFLDRTNVGNAKIIGLEKNVGINGEQYRNGLAIYYACYIARFVHHRTHAYPCHC